MKTTKSVDHLVRVVVHDQGVMTAWNGILGYDPVDPHAATLRLVSGGYNGCWTFAADLLADVITTSIAGDEHVGAVHMYRAAQRPGQVEIWVRHDGRRLAVVVATSDLERFVDAADAAMSPNDRHAAVMAGVDQLADALLWGDR